MRAMNANATLPPAPRRAGANRGLTEDASPKRRGSRKEKHARHGGAAPRTHPAGPALLVACGNSLRQDDGVGLRIAEAAEHLFPASRLRIVAAQQLTPEMAADLAKTELAIFVDASAMDEPGAIRFAPVTACPDTPELHGFGAHSLEPPALLAMAQTLCGHAPARAFALTVGACHFGYGEDLSGPLRQAVPRALRLVGNLVGVFGKRA